MNLPRFLPFRPARLTALCLLLLPAAALADSDFEDAPVGFDSNMNFERAPWAEGAMELPAWPGEDRDLLRLNVSTEGLPYTIYLDPASLTTGADRVVRYTVVQDAGKAIHPDYVEGQFQGGAAQGIGWALNEEYIYGKDGRLQNPGFLDYRVPVCSDLPFIDTKILEIPNPGHPYGVRGVGETPIVPPLAAIGNAVSAAAGVRLTELPMSPPRIVAAIDACTG